MRTRYYLPRMAFLMSLILCVPFFSSASADVAIQPTGSCGAKCTFYAIAVSGPIDGRTRTEFQTAASDPRVKASLRHFSVTVILNSPGGDVSEAMEIGHAIRNAGFMTAVGENDECSSACVFILAAGVVRIAEFGHVGIHRPHFDERYFASLPLDKARSKYEQMSNAVREYLSQMGMTDSLYLDVMNISSDEVVYLTADKMTEYRLIGRDPAWSEYNRARAIRSEGREQYDVNQNWSAVFLACLNKFGPGASCDKDALAEFQRELDDCTAKGSDRVACAKIVADRMVQVYATP